MSQSSPFAITLINPNSSAVTTARMVEIAQATAHERGFDALITGLTAEAAPSMIVDDEGLAAGAREVRRLCDGLVRSGSPCSVVIVAAFGDPGFEAAIQMFPDRTVGIGEAALVEAAAGGRRFAVATTTPGLVDAIGSRVMALGLADRFIGTRLTAGDPLALMADATVLENALARAVEEAVERDQAEAIVIGGGPLAVAARALRRRFSIEIVEPLPAAVRRAQQLLSTM